MTHDDLRSEIRKIVATRFEKSTSDYVDEIIQHLAGRINKLGEYAKSNHPTDNSIYIKKSDVIAMLTKESHDARQS